MTRLVLSAAFLLLLLPISERTAIAHRMGVFAQIDGENIIGRAYFADGSPCSDCAILAQNPAGETIARTATYPDGRFLFPKPPPMDLTVIAESELGHRSLFILSTAGHAPEPLEPMAAKPPKIAQPLPEQAATPWGALAAGIGLIAVIFSAWAMLARKRARS
jgi:nickel transport protein